MWPYSTYSKINPVAEENFPFKKPRPDQLETISQIIEAIDKGYKYNKLYNMFIFSSTFNK